MKRRAFLKTGVSTVGGTILPLGGCGQSSTASPAQYSSTISSVSIGMPLATPPIPLVRVGLVGLGQRGTKLLESLVLVPNMEVKAICDLDSTRALAAAAIVKDTGYAPPVTYSGDVNTYLSFCDSEELDLIVVATPWEWHVPVCLKAMETGSHVAVEVPAATTIEECWKLVETAEAFGKHCVMLENVNYFRPEMMVLNLVRQGILGDLIHGECGYQHDLRKNLLSETRNFPPYWRVEHHRKRNANLYPTHGLGPIANYMGINSGDRFTQLVSMSSMSLGLNKYATQVLGPLSPYNGTEFKCGDYVSALIQTDLGRTVYISFNTVSPRPYSRINSIQGSKGIFEGFPDRIYIENRSSKHNWEEAETYYTEFEHPLWRKWNSGASSLFSGAVGHGGGDNIMLMRLIDLLNRGKPMDMTVYDAATLSAVTELTAISINNGGVPVEFPDFTRGNWRSWPAPSFGLHS